MPQISEEDLQILHTLLDAEPEALARYNKLADYKKEMCLRWIADAPAPRLREQRIHRLVRRLWLTAFDPYYDIGGMTLSELDENYGPPRQLLRVPEDEQAEALRERRVLGAYHYRNFDDGGTSFYIVDAETKRFVEFMLVYQRPCVLTENIIGWLNRNNIETVAEMRDYLLPAQDAGPESEGT
jgi:hypothetical protein